MNANTCKNKLNESKGYRSFPHSFWFKKDVEISLILLVETKTIWQYNYCDFKSRSKYVSCKKFVNHLISLIK